MSKSEKERGDHYSVKVEHLTPTKIVCKCGATFTGQEALGLMEAHITLQSKVSELEQELERRNVFDQNKRDEESP